jgi:hypothetical protein
MICEHNFSYAGLVYSFEKYSLPGSGAHGVIYEDRFFCQKCLELRDINPRVVGDSYSKRIEGSIPK